jgi:hypothetical protein
MQTDPSESQPSEGAIRCWQAHTPIGAVTIGFYETGTWKVVFEGFSRSTNRSLASALAEATGARHNEPWVDRLAAAIKRQRV